MVIQNNPINYRFSLLTITEIENVVNVLFLSENNAENAGNYLNEH